MTAIGLTDAMWAEIRQVVADLPADVSAVATGSIVEGLGNRNSDIDLYLVYEKGSPRQGASIGLRRSRYVDCEHMRLGSLKTLAETVRASGWEALQGLRARDVSRFYRTSIGVPVTVTDAAKDVLARFDKATACEVVERWALLRTYETLARAQSARALGALPQAGLLLREAAGWYATTRLAAVGEGYPSLKWAAAKAARRYGRGSAEFHDLVDGFARAGDDLDAGLERLGSALRVSTDLHEALERRAASLAERVRLVGAEDGESGYLLKPGGLMTPVRDLAFPVCRGLAAGGSWHEVTGDLADSLGLPPALLRVAAWYQTTGLRADEFLTEVK